MPPNRFIFNTIARRNFVCRSCLVDLQRQPPKPWQVRRPFSQSTDRVRLDKKQQPPKFEDTAESTTTEDHNVSLRFFEEQADGSMRQLRDSTELADSMNREVREQYDAAGEQLQELERQLESAS